MKVKWEKNEGRYLQGDNAVVGKWTVGYVGYDCLPKNDEKKYIATCTLPGIKSSFGHFETAELAKERIEKAVSYWFANVEAE